jgi:hypothetical protein
MAEWRPKARAAILCVMPKGHLAKSLVIAASLFGVSCSGDRGADAGVASKPLDTPAPSASAAAPAQAGENPTEDAAAGTVEAKVAAPPPEETKAVPADVAGAVKKAESIPECAELERRSACSIEKLPDEVARKEVKRALEEAMATWGDFASDEGTRKQAASACTQAITEGDALWTSQGC